MSSVVFHEVTLYKRYTVECRIFFCIFRYLGSSYLHLLIYVWPMHFYLLSSVHHPGRKYSTILHSLLNRLLSKYHAYCKKECAYYFYRKSTSASLDFFDPGRRHTNPIWRQENIMRQNCFWDSWLSAFAIGPTGPSIN